ncbi:FACT complex subunit Ssrp1-like [Drosophila pseudoobscura]|uniref:FACT complex subunit Ssrp1-like n=1 Tax=Drosophila pseudoobscura pseudoobscura TaxID=46245 RepID=A0A6I8VRZ5_DROPS|nr:FACT complex subunit Ssrp1 [Drosophila pseudoobscura]
MPSPKKRRRKIMTAMIPKKDVAEEYDSKVEADSDDGIDASGGGGKGGTDEKKKRRRIPGTLAFMLGFKDTR